MEIFVFFLAILVVGAIIGISMIAFKVAFASLLKAKLLEDELNQLKTQSVKPNKLKK